MENRINFGIDLGTTNSAIAKFVKGEVEVFKNPLETGKETLPSVVYYKADNIIVGSRARTYLERDTKNVFSSFKRKMGTTESFKVKNLSQSKTPIDLSSEIIKELKRFIHTGEQIDAAIITVPASFELPQIKATQEAGYLAGLKQVITLPEPIAASLAYANKRKENDIKNGQWLVYDLGGGTFDVALMKVKDGEIKVLDHEGHNFLGGADFDNLIVENIIIPFLNKNYNFKDLENELKSESSKRNSLYYRLLLLAEEAKKQLSNLTSTDLELRDIKDDSGAEIDIAITITRSEFENLIKEDVDRTIEMIKKILVRKSLKSSDVKFTLMVGGSTYIPYVRKRVEEILQISNNLDIDPTTAIAIGAAYYAGNKDKNFDREEYKKITHGIKVRLSYQKNSFEEEEILAARIDGNIQGLYYQITREDKGYDSGRKNLAARITEDLPLVKESYNFFRFIILDEQNNIIETDADIIGIAQGKVEFGGTPISHDICLELDAQNSVDNYSTKLDLLFKKGSILPLKWNKVYTLQKSLIKGTNDRIIINLLEGSHTSIAEALSTIAYLEINGKMIERDVLKGTDIEIKVELSDESDLKASAYLTMTNQEFNVPVTISDRDTLVGKLKDDIDSLNNRTENEIKQAVEREDYEVAEGLSVLKTQLQELVVNANKIQEDDVTDNKFQLEDKKRKYAQQFYEITKDKQMSLVKVKYNEDKEWCKEIVDENGNDHDHKIFNDIVVREQVFLNSMTPLKILEAIDQLIDLGSNILWRTPAFLERRFKKLIEKPQIFNDQEQAKVWIEAGNLAIQNKNYDKLREVNWGLISLSPKPPKGSSDYDDRLRIGFN